MKKFFMFAAMASVALASCVKNEPVQTPEFGSEISFESPVLAPNVKSVNEVGTGFENATNFDVWAFLSAEKLTGEAEVNWDNNYITKGEISQKTVSATTVWGGVTAYYWPTSGYLNFIAVSPSGVANATATSAGITITGYTVAAAADVDLLYSERTLGKNANNVQILFKHALASIDFKAAQGDQNTWIKSIKIVGVANTGNFAQGLANKANSVTPEGDLWSNEDGEATYIAYQGTGANGYTALTSVLTDLSAGDNKTSLILLPQTFAAESTAKIVVEYHQGLTPTQSTTAKEFEYPLKGSEWSNGVRYTYSMTFGVNEIFFEPSTAAWGTDPVTMQ